MFASYEIREYESGDVPGLVSLWAESFGDERALVERFFELLPTMGTGYVAERMGETIGAAYLLNTQLNVPEKLPEGCAYIYAVAVEPEQRGQGIGAALTRKCLRSAWDRGIASVFTLPASASLYGWYERIMGAKPVSYCRIERVEPSDAALDITELHADEYGFRRYDLLCGRAHMSFGHSYLLFQQALCRAYGGGMFAGGGGIVCGYLDGNTLMIKEALNDPPELVPALCRRLGARSALIRRQTSSGEPYLTAYSLGKLPSPVEWNLTLD